MKKMFGKEIKRNVISIFVFTATISLLTGCTSEFSGTGQISSTINSSSSTQVSQNSPDTTVEAQPAINFRIFAPHDRMMLIPTSVPDYDQGIANGDTLFFLLSDDMTTWEPVTCTASKIGSVTGQLFYEEQDTTVDIFQMKIGDWIGYYQRNSELKQDNIERRMLLDDNLICEPRSKDYTVMQIFNDLYAVGVDSRLKMVSSRKIKSYDYDTISKEGIGDLYGWSWISYPVCSIKDNLVFYLTAREKEFYSIWELDLDSGAEKRFGKDIAFRLNGVGNNQLIAFMDGDHSDTYGKLISTSDAKSFAEMTDNGWASSNGWLFNQDEMNLKFESGDIQLETNTGRAFYPLLLKDNILWLAELSPIISKLQYIRIDLKNATYSITSAGYHNTMDGWNKYLFDLNLNELPIEQAASHGIRIVLKK